jgi:hypothetical protein
VAIQCSYAKSSLHRQRQSDAPSRSSHSNLPHTPLKAKRRKTRESHTKGISAQQELLRQESESETQIAGTELKRSTHKNKSSNQ